MTVVLVYLRLYGACLQRALRGIGKNPWTLLLPMGGAVASFFLGMLFSGLGLVGGLLFSLAVDALLSSYLYFVNEVVSHARVEVTALKQSILPYFWSVLNLMFVLWVVEFLLAAGLRNSDQATYIFFITRLAAFVLLNACPEIIYLKGSYGGIATIQGSIEFIHRNWIEWFVPNLLFGAVFFYGLPAALRVGVPLWIMPIVGGALLHVVMVFRGHLFQELDRSSHRQRMFKYRTAETAT